MGGDGIIKSVTGNVILKNNQHNLKKRRMIYEKTKISQLPLFHLDRIAG